MNPRLALFVAMTLALTGCSSLSPYNVPSPGSPASPSAPSGQDQAGQAAEVPAVDPSDDTAADGAIAELPVPDPGPPPVSAAAARLVTTSRDQRNAGNLTGAAATIERALAIEPDEALLWIELAEIRQAQGDETTAVEMARKAMTLTNEGTPVYERARRIARR